MDCSLPGSSVHGIFQARVLEWMSLAITKFRKGEERSYVTIGSKFTLVFWNFRAAWGPLVARPGGSSPVVPRLGWLRCGSLGGTLQTVFYPLLSCVLSHALGKRVVMYSY